MAELTRQELGNELVVTEHAGERLVDSEVMHLYGHSQIFYWWPVWAFGIIMAGLTWFFGETVMIGDVPARFVRGNLLGFVFTLVLVLVFLFTNLSMRGLVSGMVILGLAFVAVVLAWLNLWDKLLSFIPDITVYMNTGYYIFLTVAVFIAWALSFFIFDRLQYWRISAGQIVYKQVVGGAEQSFDTTSAVFEELHIDFFKHGLLGLGACDLKITTRGPKQTDFYIPNVLFGHWKVLKIQELIKRKPD